MLKRTVSSSGTISWSISHTGAYWLKCGFALASRFEYSAIELLILILVFSVVLFVRLSIVSVISSCLQYLGLLFCGVVR